MARSPDERDEWLRGVDAFLATTSWDSTWERMWRLVESAIGMRERVTAAPSR
jgi:hypothetical protein